MVSVCLPLRSSLSAYHLTWFSRTLGVGYLFTAAPAKRSSHILHKSYLLEKLADYDPWVKSVPLSIFVNEIFFLEHSFVYLPKYLPISALAELSSCNRQCIAYNTEKDVLSDPL